LALCFAFFVPLCGHSSLQCGVPSSFPLARFSDVFGGIRGLTIGLPMIHFQLADCRFFGFVLFQDFPVPLILPFRSSRSNLLSLNFNGVNPLSDTLQQKEFLYSLILIVVVHGRSSTPRFIQRDVA
jgi:hypothetical protein